MKNRGVYEDENVSWCVFITIDQGNIPPEIDTGLDLRLVYSTTQLPD
jgi:hypothetical protein